MAIKADGTLWGWGRNLIMDALGTNQAHNTNVSSPKQIPGTTWTALVVNHLVEHILLKHLKLMEHYGHGEMGGMEQLGLESTS